MGGSRDTGTPRGVYLFDTSALLDFPSSGRNKPRALLERLVPAARYVYHPISLAELATNAHEVVHERRRGNEEGNVAAQRRRHLLHILSLHAKRDASRVHGRRFLPLAVVNEHFQELVRQCRDPRNLRVLDGRIYSLCPMVDHQILACARSVQRRGHDMTLVSGDRAQIEAASAVGIPWIYTKNPAFVPTAPTPLPWAKPLLKSLT